MLVMKQFAMTLMEIVSEALLIGILFVLLVVPTQEISLGRHLRLGVASYRRSLLVWLLLYKADSRNSLEERPPNRLWRLRFRPVLDPNVHRIRSTQTGYEVGSCE